MSRTLSVERTIYPGTNHGLSVVISTSLTRYLYSRKMGMCADFILRNFSTDYNTF